VLRRNDREARVSAGIISRHPRESVAMFVGGAAIMIISANALFMQPGPHPAPMFSSGALRPKAIAPGPLAPKPLSPRPSRFEPVQLDKLPPPRPVEATAVKPAKPAANEPPRQDPIAQLLAPSKRVTAVQQILAAYGYGQIKPTGAVDKPTEDAIRKFEASRKMPVTGQVSDQLVRALSAMSGKPIE
jgi:Putative peptidoglycan binding domain